ncbi:hypothetical protein BU15DRAFT_79331 [Melanogaster broomeanus]|nr:hypothetical protein BU15DRAFT_79331 [Melanogaster broomeanus]
MIDLLAADLNRAIKPHDYGKHEAREATLLAKVPPGPPEVLDSPAIIIDKYGVVLLWYLPGALDVERQRIMMDASSLVKDALQNSCISDTGSWRTDPKLFHSRANGIRGCVNMSPAWYQQGHSGAPEVGAMLKAKNAKKGGREWLEKMGETNALLAGAISVMHPELYVVGREVMLTVARKART